MIGQKRQVIDELAELEDMTGGDISLQGTNPPGAESELNHRFGSRRASNNGNY